MHVWEWAFCLLTVFTVNICQCSGFILSTSVVTYLISYLYLLWLFSCSLWRGVVCGKDRARPAHLWTVEEWKEKVIFPGSGQLRRPGSNLYEHLSPINPAVKQLRRSENLPFGTISIPAYRTRKERPGTLTAGETPF